MSTVGRPLWLQPPHQAAVADSVPASRGRIVCMRSLLLALAVATAAAQAPDAESRMNQGIEAYRNGRYAAAAAAFADALKLDPGYLDARLYLATAYMAQYVPGSDDPANTKLALKA